MGYNSVADITDLSSFV